MAIHPLSIGLIGGLAAITFSLLPVGDLAELKGYDLLHAGQFEKAPAEEIVLVAIDEPSFAEIGRQWPWPRSLHAQLVEALARSGATVIGFDVLFAEPSRPDEDAALAQAIRMAGNVVLAADIETSDQHGFSREMRIDPYSQFGAHASSGIVKVPLDRDNVVRRFLPRQAGDSLFSEEVARMRKSSLRPVPAEAWIAFRSPPGTFRSVSYYQALHPENFLPPGFFQGKIVLIGKTVSSATGTTADYYGTPFLSLNEPLMSGLELHAVMTSNVLDANYVIRAPTAVRLLILGALGLLAGLLQWHWHPARSAVLAGAAGFAYLAAAFVAFDHFGYWLPTVSTLPALLVPYGISAISAYLVTERKRLEIRRAFGHYLSPPVLEMILASPDNLKLGGHRVEATILFSDIIGFTSLAEEMAPEDIQKMINLYLTAMAREIFAERGTIDKYIGDAIMAFWGAPLADPDQALHACRAALAMQKALKGLQPTLTREGYPAIAARIGINTGSVIVGNMGSETLFSYTVLGDAVNLASRLEAANKEFGTSIIISEETYGKVMNHVDVRSLGSIRVKGKSRMVAIYELLSCSSQHP